MNKIEMKDNDKAYKDCVQKKLYPRMLKLQKLLWGKEIEGLYF